MDNQKDIDKLNTASDYAKSNSGMAVFRGSKAIVLHKRTERLVAAIYLISELLHDIDPLKNRLRQSGVDIVSFMLSFNNFFSPDGKSFSSQYAVRILEILSLLDIAHLSGLISEMNHRIMMQEIEKLIDMAESIKKEPSVSTALNKEFFAIEKDIQNMGEQLLPGTTPNSDRSKMRLIRMIPKSIYKGHLKGHLYSNKMSDRRGNNGHDVLVRSSNKESRRKLIIEMLSGGKSMTVKDFLSVISDRGEKTIQRELLSMVRENVLKKEGERRWSRYSIRVGES